MERNIQLRDGRILRENRIQDIVIVGGGSINQSEIWTYESAGGSSQKVFVKVRQSHDCRNRSSIHISFYSLLHIQEKGSMNTHIPPLFQWPI